MNALEAQSVPSPNGQHRPMPSRAQLEAELVGEPLTTGYQATLPIDTMWGPDGVPIYQFRRDIEWMVRLPMVKPPCHITSPGLQERSSGEGQIRINQTMSKGCQSLKTRKFPLSSTNNARDFGIGACRNFSTATITDGWVRRITTPTKTAR